MLWSGLPAPPQFPSASFMVIWTTHRSARAPVDGLWLPQPITQISPNHTYTIRLTHSNSSAPSKFCTWALNSHHFNIHSFDHLKWATTCQPMTQFSPNHTCAFHLTHCQCCTLTNLYACALSPSVLPLSAICPKLAYQQPKFCWKKRGAKEER